MFSTWEVIRSGYQVKGPLGHKQTLLWSPQQPSFPAREGGAGQERQLGHTEWLPWRPEGDPCKACSQLKRFREKRESDEEGQQTGGEK